jgi:hypothetical protein
MVVNQGGKVLESSDALVFFCFRAIFFFLLSYTKYSVQKNIKFSTTYVSMISNSMFKLKFNL